MVLHHGRLHLWAFDGSRSDTLGPASGGEVVGSTRHPLNTADFSSYLLRAQASGAKVVALANSASDMTNAVKQANEFGLKRAGQTIVPMLTFITDIHSIGLEAAQGLRFLTAFYWDRDDDSRAWSKQFFERHKRMPTAPQAVIYSAIRHYLRAIEATGTDEVPSWPRCGRFQSTTFTRRTDACAKTAGWSMTCILSR